MSITTAYPLIEKYAKIIFEIIQLFVMVNM
jgi:hypothetical protein